MKKWISFGVVFFSMLTAFATNPQIRACRTSGGEFFVVNTENDQIGLCKLGLSVVGSIDILNKSAQIEIPLSLFNYRRGVKVCPSQNLTEFTTFEGDKIYVCQYSDGSVIDVETLTSGKDSGRNTQLDAALSFR